MDTHLINCVHAEGDFVVVIDLLTANFDVPPWLRSKNTQRIHILRKEKGFAMYSYEARQLQRALSNALEALDQMEVQEEEKN